jgi:hypothetical protein
MPISNPKFLSSSETGIIPGRRSKKMHLSFADFDIFVLIA